MPVPALDPWRARSDAMPLHRLLGIRADAIGPGTTLALAAIVAAVGGTLLWRRSRANRRVEA